MTGVQTCALPICFPVTIRRVSAVNTSLTNQFIFDSFFNIKMARPMPMFSVPGSIDHF